VYLRATRPDITYAVRLISIFMEYPKISHWKVGKIILRYIAGNGARCEPSFATGSNYRFIVDNIHFMSSEDNR
jgi:hypothetical protein